MAARAAELLLQQERRIHVQTDRLFAVLFLIQWLAAICAALWLSPRTWAGLQSETHVHVWAAIYVGGLIALFPILLVVARPATLATRCVVAVAQMLMSSLLIQLTGGRIETHFHVFGSLAFLSFYRDWRVLVPATIVVAGDHFLRGWLWPQSVFGTLVVNQWRWVEHAGWVIFEDVFLIVACVRSEREMRAVSERSAQLEASEERYRSVMEQAAEGICLLDPVSREVIESNRAFARLLDRTETDPTDERADGFTVVRRAIARLVASEQLTGSPVPHDCCLRRADGSPLYLSLTVSRISFRSRDVLCVSVRDVTERRLAQEALRRSEERYVRAARGANDGLWDWDLTTGEVYFSPRWKDMLGLTHQDVGSFDQWLKRIHVEDHSPFLSGIKEHIDGRSEYFEHQHRMQHADGSYRWMLCRGLVARNDDGKPARMAGSQTDVTERHLASEQLRHAALHDNLTGLPNRLLFSALLERAVARIQRHPDDMFAVLFLDIDRFKIINDSLGHLVGDQLLERIGRRVRDSLRAGDVLARIGGDEFTILADDVGHPDDAVTVAEVIQDALKEPFVVNGHDICVSASIGIAVGSVQYQRGEDLLRDADIAMYRAKALGKNRCQVFDPAMREGAVDRLTLENDLRGALDRQEFVLSYQPILSVKSRRIVGFEALVRWQRPDGLSIPPGEFIPIAEETGLIVPLGHWVLKAACRQLAAWQKLYPADPPLTIAVNISARQLEHQGFVDEVASAIRGTDVAPGTVHLEITEGALVGTTRDIRDKLWQLKDLGLCLDLDDFGVGYSSLSYLHRLPFDMIKIDRSFVVRLEWREKRDTVVEAIISLGKNLGMGVVAEGVETAGQLALLQAASCDHVQGYFFSPPLHPARADAMLRVYAAMCA